MNRFLFLVLVAALMTPALSAQAGDVGFSLRVGNSWHSGRHPYSGHHGRPGYSGYSGYRGHHSRSHYGFTFNYGWPIYRNSYYRSSYIYRPYPRSVVYDYACPPATTSYIITNPQPQQTVVYVPAQATDSRVVYGSATERVYEPQTRVYQPQPPSQVIDAPRRTISVTGQSWPLLRDGHYQQALEQFSAESQLSPGDGLPKVGYALAAAAQGDLNRGVWAMRRAMRVDPDAASRVSLGDAMREPLFGMIDSYVLPLPGDGVSDKDSAFMVACLHLIAGEMQPAADAIDRAIAAGDGSEEARQVSRMVASSQQGQ
jgi:hypothetical protein